MSKTKKIGPNLTIKGVTLLDRELYRSGPYKVYVGYMSSRDSPDIPHYLIVNTLAGVIEGSTARMMEARALAYQLDSELQQQDKLIENAESLTNEPSYGPKPALVN